VTNEEYEKTRAEWLRADYTCMNVADCCCPKCDPDLLMDRLADLALVVGRPFYEHPIDCKCEPCWSGPKESKTQYRRRMMARITQRGHIR